MDIKGTVHCFFEQLGTFKNEFKKLGFRAFDYDIQNNFSEVKRPDLFGRVIQLKKLVKNNTLMYI